MLSLHHIVKNYVTGDTKVTALNEISLDFREHEFVSILGPSGCGKTTLLNIIGGLDRYDSGNLLIGGRSTDYFRDADWDAYRNHSVGFVFQSYNLIMHQTVLSNVELALTLSGVSREERKRRATEALTQVGLGDQLYKKPNQMSGGQMQRVAIARALVNDPDIILADEPTGALDTATSIQIMDILKSVSEKKLIIMVTHNPDLALQYSSRIIRLLDGKITEDTNPCPPSEEAADEPADKTENVVASVEKTPDIDGTYPDTDAAESVKRIGKPAKRCRKTKRRKKGEVRNRSMSFFTALSLSFHNLLTKKTRTALVSVAGSIGIIGIALILSLSNGVNLYISHVQEETLTSYPISITSKTADYSALLSAIVDVQNDPNGDREREPRTVYVNDSVANMVSAMTATQENNLAAFDDYLRAHWNEIKDDLTAVQYTYDTDLQIYHSTDQYGLVQASPADVFNQLSGTYPGMELYANSISIFSEIMPGRDGELINPTIYEQYELLDGAWPTAANELVLIVDENCTVTNLTLYILGMRDPAEFSAMMMSMFTGEPYHPDTSDITFSFDDFYNLTLNLVFNSDYYRRTETVYEVGGNTYHTYADRRDDEGFDPATLLADGMELKFVGIVSAKKGATSGSIRGSVGYTSALTHQVLEKINDSAVVRQQLETPDYDVFTGLPFVIDDAEQLSDAEKKEKLSGYFSTLNNHGKAELYGAIQTAIPAQQMTEMLEILKNTFPTEDERREFLVSLYGMGNKQGSLQSGTSANKAAAAILYALHPDPSKTPEENLAYYQSLAPYYERLLGLDGNELLPGNESYDNYLRLIGMMYPTQEKINRAFENMSRATITSFYKTEKTAQIQQSLVPSGPHYQNYLHTQSAAYPTAGEKRTYLIAALSQGSTVPVSVVTEYVNGLDDTQLATEFSKAVTAAYVNRLQTDPDFNDEAVAAQFDAYLSGLEEPAYAALYADYMVKSDSTLQKNLEEIGASTGRDALSAINIYPVDFAAKGRLENLITTYNNSVENEKDKISYTDVVSLIMSSVTTIINAISYVLIAFVSISLVVSSIMIGIITYISVLERIKEIGILRAIGASKRDISRVFNAETLIIGFCAGLLGVLITVLLCLPLNLIIHRLSGIAQINAALPPVAGLVLLAISMVLTLIAGLIPSMIAAKKDPVVALRTE